MSEQLGDCDICRDTSWRRDELKHLPIYVNGSEGVVVCPHCSQAVTEYMRGLRSAAYRAHKNGFVAGRVKTIEKATP